MTYKSFKNETYKSKILWETSQKQENEIELLPTENLIFTQEHLNKKINIIPLLQNSPIIWEYAFNLVDFPEWMIPMVRPLGYFSVPGEGFDATQVDFSGGAEISLNYWFNKIGENIYTFRVQINTDASFETDLLANIFLYIINTRNFDTINKAKQ